MPSMYGGPITTFEDAEKESKYRYICKRYLEVVVADGMAGDAMYELVCVGHVGPVNDYTKIQFG
ncbi:hypothetical protein OROHE_000683 [Orobanche hederae]